MSTMQRPVILIVDDEEENLDLLERTLMFDYEVHRASSGEEALERIEGLPELAMIITDQRMPGMTGTQLLSKVCDQRAEAVRIIVTGYTSPDDLIEAINSSNVYRYLTKPWDVDDLLAIVRRAVRLSQAGVGGLVHEVTGLPGRFQLLRELEREVIRAQQLGYTLSLERITLLGFATYEEQVGVAAAEDVLRRVADALLQKLPPLGFLAGLNRGVYVTLLSSIAGEVSPREPLPKMLESLYVPPAAKDTNASQIEIQRAIFPADGETPRALLDAIGLSDLPLAPVRR